MRSLQPSGLVLCLLSILAVWCPLRAASEWFDPAVLHQVRIRLPAEEWTTLRKEAPDILAQLGPARTNGLAPRAYQDHRAELEFDGKTWSGVTVRKRGFIGSVSRDRPGFNVEFPDAPDRRGPGGWRKLTLANTQQDASSSHLSLANGLFREMGVPAARTALARVEVNGELLGVYTVIEPVDREFLARHFGDGNGPMWEGALTDLRPEWLGMFEAKRGTKPEDLEILKKVAGLLAQKPAVDWTEVEKFVDLDRFLTFWAAEMLVDHWDGYANNGNNYFIHRRASDGRLVFVPWGADQCLGSPNPFTPARAPVSVRATGLLCRLLYLDPVWREKYRARVRQLLDSAWDETRWVGEVERLDRLVGTNAWAGVTGRRAVVQRTKEFMRKRKTGLRKDLAGEAPAWTFPEKTNTLVRLWGKVTADFDTTFQAKLPVNWFTNGTVDLRLELDGKPRPFTKAGVAVSRALDSRDTNKVSVNVLGMHGIAAFLVPSVQVWREEFEPGRTVKVDFFANQGFFFEGMPMAEGGGAGLLSGTIRLDEASTREGDRVRGRLEAEVWQFPK
jgi:hypothetical protein